MPRFPGRLLGIPSPQELLRLAICPLVRVRSAGHGRAELLITGSLLWTIRKVQNVTIFRSRLLHGLCTVLARFLVGLQGEGNLPFRGDVGKQDAEGGSIFNGLGCTLGDIWARELSDAASN